MSSAAKIDLKYPNSKFLKSEFYILFLYLNSVVANRVLDNSFTSFKLNRLENYHKVNQITWISISKRRFGSRCRRASNDL